MNSDCWNPGLKAYNFIKKRLQHKGFLVTFLEHLFLKNTSDGCLWAEHIPSPWSITADFMSRNFQRQYRMTAFSKFIQEGFWYVWVCPDVDLFASDK